MTTKDLLLTIDNGTQSLKAMAFDLSGRIQGIVKLPFTPYFSEKPGWAEQDPEMYWDLLGRACQGLWSEKKSSENALPVSRSPPSGAP